MEILDPERRRYQPVVTLEAFAGQSWCCEKVKEILSQDLWIKDLIALPFGFFKRVIGSLRRQGMKEKYVSPIVVFYANKWVLSKKTRQFWENSGERNGENDEKGYSRKKGYSRSFITYTYKKGYSRNIAQSKPKCYAET